MYRDLHWSSQVTATTEARQLKQLFARRGWANRTALLIPKCTKYLLTCTWVQLCRCSKTLGILFLQQSGCFEVWLVMTSLAEAIASSIVTRLARCRASLYCLFALLRLNEALHRNAQSMPQPTRRLDLALDQQLGIRIGTALQESGCFSLPYTWLSSYSS